MLTNFARRISVFATLFAVLSLSAATPCTSPTEGWTADTVAPGCIWYNFTGNYAPTASEQTINVLQVDLSKGWFPAVVHTETPDSLSAFATAGGALAGVNGSYFEPEVSFVRVDGTLWRQITAPASHPGYWKNRGALMLDPATGHVAIRYGTNDTYLASPYPTVLSGAPMLVYDYDPVGLTFAAVPDSVDILTLDYEDYRRHQGVRHPRVAVALTGEGRLLLAAVDGRWPEAAGMTCAELTAMLVRHFGVRYALNIDGGGSTTMFVSGRGAPETHVVNYPNDNKRHDHYGQRAVNNVVLILPQPRP